MADSGYQRCFHCDLKIELPQNIEVTVLGKSRAMCCQGCAAVARAIVGAGLEEYYTHRTEASPQGQQLVPEALQSLLLYDHPDVQKTFVKGVTEHIQEVSLILEGISCAACVWLNQQHLKQLSGVSSVEINYTSLKATVQWDDRQISLSEILKSIQLIGYIAHPYDPARRQHLLEKSRKDVLKRLGVAGIFGMQVMGLAISLYLDDGSMDAGIEKLLQRSSLLLTLPVIFYAAQPFFSGAIKDMKNRRFGMDTPVALGMGLAFIASIFSLISGRGEIYFDSVCMFSFFLLGARYLEIAARKRAADSADLVTRVKPVMARRINPAGNIENLPALELECGDRVLVHAGDIVPADGVIVSGETRLDESILTGESLPQAKLINDQLIGGSLNIDSPITMRVNRVGSDSVMSGIQRLLDDAQQAKPAISRLADKIAAWFVLGVLSLSSLTGLYWYLLGIEDWLSPTIAVLIVSCPCALSLATPVTITTAIGCLMQEGIVVSRKKALETLHRIEVMFFDKTGTLSEGKLEMQTCLVVDKAYVNSHLAICSAMEQHSDHPLARVFTQHPTALIASSIKYIAGKGLTAQVDRQTWFLGTPEYVCEQTGHELGQGVHKNLSGQTLVVLASTQGVVAIYGLADALRDESPALICWLQQQGIEPIMLTGDRPDAANRVAEQLGIERVFAGQLPAEKLAIMRGFQTFDGKPGVVGMVGDGVNDAAVLAGADCSIAIQGAAQLASAGSDILLLTAKISAVKIAVQTARKMHRIIRQNLLWASSYNLLAIPAAAVGYVPPWLAAIGMSLSSLLVVLNALRLKKVAD